MKTVIKYPNEADLMAALRASKSRPAAATDRTSSVKRTKRRPRANIAPICFNHF